MTDEYLSAAVLYHTKKQKGTKTCRLCSSWLFLLYHTKKQKGTKTRAPHRGAVRLLYHTKKQIKNKVLVYQQ